MICSRSSRPRPRPWRARRHRRPSTIASMTRRRRTGARPRRRRASGTGLPAAIDPKGVPTHLSTLSIRLIFAGRLRTHRDIASPCRGRVVLLVPALLLLSAATHRSDPPPPCLDPLCFLFHSLVTAAAHRASPCSAEESTRVLVGETMPACRYAMAGGATGLQGRHAND